MPRPIFHDEILEAIDGDYEPQYDIKSADGELTGAKLILKNPIASPGTPHNAATMNNMFDIENLDSMVGNTKETTFNADGSILEKVTAGGYTNATRLTEFPTSSTIRETTTIYDDLGVNILRKSIITTTVNANGNITEVVS